MTALDSSILSHHGPLGANAPMLASAEDVFRIPASSVQRILRGVLQATRTSEEDATTILLWMESCFSKPLPGLPRLGIQLPPKVWKEKMMSELGSEAGHLRHLATTALAIACLRERCEKNGGDTI